MGKRKRRSDRERRAMFASLKPNYAKVRLMQETPHAEISSGSSFVIRRHVNPRTNRIIKKCFDDEHTKPIETNRKPQQTINFSETVKSIKKISSERFVSLLAGTLATGLSFAIGNPAPILIYKSIKTTKMLYDLSNDLQKTNLRDELKNITNTFLEAAEHVILKQKIELLSKKITEKSEGIGIIKLLSESSNFDENAIRLLFQNTVNNIIDDSLGTMTNLTVDTLL